MAISIYLEINIYKNSVYQKWWDMAKEKLRRKSIVFGTYVSWQERMKINELSFDFKKLEKEQPTKPKESDRKRD